MNVLALVPDFVEKPSGGLGEQFRYIQKHLQGKVNYFTVGYPEKNNIKNYRSCILPYTHEHAALNTIVGQSLYFLEGIKFNKTVDLIHAYDWSTFYAGVLASWYLEKPLVCTVQLSLQLLNKSGIFYCSDINTSDGSSINNIQVLMEQLGLYYANHIIHVSKYYGSFFDQYKDKSTVIYNGIDLEEWNKKETPALPGKNKIKFCYIGRASPQKGIDTILNCVIPDDVDLYFVVSEKNAQEPFFSNIKKKCNNINIFHIPGLYGQDKIDFLYAMDGVIMPSTHEPFGIVALEALISENILITTAVDGIAEIVNGIDFLKITNSYDLLQAITKIKKMDENTKNKIKLAGKERAKKFEWSVMAEQLFDVYKKTYKLKYNPNEALKVFYEQR